MRWTKYSGFRIPVPGHRTFVEDPPVARFGESRRRYGYVWSEAGIYRGYFEVPHPGEVEDVAVSPSGSAREARDAVESALLSARDCDRNSSK